MIWQSDGASYVVDRISEHIFTQDSKCMQIADCLC